MWTALCVSIRTKRPQDQFHQLARELRPEYAGMDERSYGRRSAIAATKQPTGA